MSALPAGARRDDSMLDFAMQYAGCCHAGKMRSQRWRHRRQVAFNAGIVADRMSSRQKWRATESAGQGVESYRRSDEPPTYERRAAKLRLCVPPAITIFPSAVRAQARIASARCRQAQPMTTY